MFKATLVSLFLPLVLAGQPVFAEDLTTVDLIGARAVDVQGSVHRLGLDAKGGAGLGPVALVFLDPGCPISNRYAPRLQELSILAAERGISFFGVFSDPELSAEEGRAYREEYGLSFPILFDASGDLAARLDPHHVPEAFVVATDDRLVYRGRIDDRFQALGKLRARVTSHDLLEALEGAASDSSAARITEAVGCVSRPGRAAGAK